MLVDARSLEDGASFDADVCVLGGGAAGITVARDVAKRTDLSVVLMESGGFEHGDSETTALYDGHVVGEPLLGGEPLTLQEVRLRWLGGTTNHWAGWCRPLRPIDFQARPGIPYPGWPIERAELVPWWEQACRVIDIGPFRFDWRYWAPKIDSGPALVDNDVVDTTVYQIGYPRAFRAMYGSELEASKNLKLIVWANVVDLPTDPSGRVTRAEAKTTTGKHLRVNAKVFVIALGGIETPRVLLAANGGRGVGNEHDLVGRFFMEHLEVPSSLVTLSRTTGQLSLFKGTDWKRPGDLAVEIKGTMGLTDATLLQYRLLGSQCILLFASPLDEVHPHQTSGANARDVAALPGAMGGRAAKTLALLQTLSEQRPNPQSRVSLGRDVDELGMPRVVLDWQLTPEDRASIVAGVGIFADELGRAGQGRIQLGKLEFRKTDKPPRNYLDQVDMDPDAFDPEHLRVQVGYHHMGTTRMSSDPSQGVVDPDCRVHSSPNLFVAGSAVFPTSGSSTPTFTIVALALRLGDHLRTKVLA
jgi:choline dehydrogenase-like flavoprotein